MYYFSSLFGLQNSILITPKTIQCSHIFKLRLCYRFLIRISVIAQKRNACKKFHSYHVSQPKHLYCIPYHSPCDLLFHDQWTDFAAWLHLPEFFRQTTCLTHNVRQQHTAVSTLLQLSGKGLSCKNYCEFFYCFIYFIKVFRLWACVWYCTVLLLVRKSTLILSLENEMTAK